MKIVTNVRSFIYCMIIALVGIPTYVIGVPMENFSGEIRDNVTNEKILGGIDQFLLNISAKTAPLTTGGSGAGLAAAGGSTSTDELKTERKAKPPLPVVAPADITGSKTFQAWVASLETDNVYIPYAQAAAAIALSRWGEAAFKVHFDKHKYQATASTYSHFSKEVDSEEKYLAVCAKCIAKADKLFKRAVKPPTPPSTELFIFGTITPDELGLSEAAGKDSKNNSTNRIKVVIDFAKLSINFTGTTDFPTALGRTPGYAMKSCFPVAEDKSQDNQ